MAADQFPRQAGGASAGVTETIPEVATQAKQHVQDKADEVKGRAVGQVREQMNTRSTQFGEQIASYGRALHNAADRLEIEGNAAGARTIGRAAGHVDRVAGYLTDSTSDRFLQDMESFGRKHPWLAGVTGLATGFLAARFVKASSESRYESTYRPTTGDADFPLRRDEHATTHPVTAGPTDGGAW